TGNLMRRPEVVQGFQRLSFGIRRGKPEQCQILALENKRQRFREGCVRNALEESVIDVIERKCLLYVVTHLMDSNIETFVIHSRFFYASAQMSFRRTHFRAHGVT